MKSPCKDCKDRFVGCHSECEEYLYFHKENTEQREKLYKLRQQEYESYGAKQHSIMKTSMKKKRCMK